MKFQKKFLSLFLVLCLVLSGCKSAGKNNSAAEKEPETTAPLLASAVSDEVIDDSWKKNGFTSSKNSGSAYNNSDSQHGFKELRYLKIPETTPDFQFASKDSRISYLRNIRYELISYKLKDGSMRYFLESRVSDAAEVDRIELFTGTEEAPAGVALTLDAVTESDIALLFKSDTPYIAGEEAKANKAYYQVVHVDANGQETSRADVSSCYRDKGINDLDMSYEWWCDENGCTYAINFKENILYVFDDKGNVVMDRRLSADRGETLPAVCHAPDGSLLFTWGKNSTNGAEIYWFDTAAKTAQMVGTLSNVYLLWSCTIEKNGQFLYGDTNYVQLWDTQTGDVTNLLNYVTSNVSNGGSVKHLSITPDGELLLYTENVDGSFEIIVMSDQAQADTSGPTLVDFLDQPYTNQAVGLFNREQPDSEKVIYSSITTVGVSEREDEWTRVMASFVAGNGPDILCVSAADSHLTTLWEKGLLADISTWIPQETQDEIFPGLRACGVMDGKLMGVCVTGSPTILITTDEICPTERWSQQDALNILKNRRGLEGVYIGAWGGFGPDMAFSFMALKHPETSPFIDFENSESHFERDEFRETLELCAKYPEGVIKPDDNTYTPEFQSDLLKLVIDGKYLAKEIYDLNVVNFSEFNKILDGHGRYIGYPGQTEYTGYWNGVVLIAVNAQTKHPETIKKFLQYYMSDEVMKQSSMNLVGKAATIEADWLPLVDLNPFTKEDIAAYIDLLSKMGPMSRTDDRLTNIISEEADIFFSGTRDAKGTADIIDNRVQLYLNEKE